MHYHTKHHHSESFILSMDGRAAIINAKYVSSNPLDRVSRGFKANDLNLSKQTMSNWTVCSAERYFQPVYELMKELQLKTHVNQCDETPLEVMHDGSKSYMWVHLTGELSPVPKIIVYEYQKTRHSDHLKEYYKDFHGVLMTDGLEQYHPLAKYNIFQCTVAGKYAFGFRHLPVLAIQTFYDICYELIIDPTLNTVWHFVFKSQ